MDKTTEIQAGGGKEIKAVKLRPIDEYFCQEYSKHGNGTRAYLKAYGLDGENPLDYARSRSRASIKLANASITARINELLTLEDFNHESMDTQLNFLAHQHERLDIKLGAIKEYNALKGRTGGKGNLFTGNTFNLAQILKSANDNPETKA